MTGLDLKESPPTTTQDESNLIDSLFAEAPSAISNNNSSNNININMTVGGVDTGFLAGLQGLSIGGASHPKESRFQWGS
eukprot:CAMPEP_0202446034 /NCGR_PEP_ID=MMETSP1360-20130828/4688_1 /ASSEMBLY_ACC=CAM_ASM_000848 /TAXON_ID=515479 /ORGANISM="Licmophora paradoxa, Strain CCMP2313" /LENGTH=78 /DNA_ID=CAMNT_0049062451 /DNA_START=102 /DNA_END=338 /DNA_ORIENTATION=-